MTQQNNKLNLSDCPCCGSAARATYYFDESAHSHAEVQYLEIGCFGCSLSLPGSEHHDEVIAAWETRVPASVVRQRQHSDPTASYPELTYEIRQEVRTVQKSWLAVIDFSISENRMRNEYDRLVAAYPNEYFELVRVTRTEECVSFTPSVGTDNALEEVRTRHAELVSWSINELRELSKAMRKAGATWLNITGRLRDAIDAVKLPVTHMTTIAHDGSILCTLVLDTDDAKQAAQAESRMHERIALRTYNPADSCLYLSCRTKG